MKKGENKWGSVGNGNDERTESFDFDTQGKELVGMYIQKKTGIGANNSEIYVIEASDGTKYGIWESTVLKDKFAIIPFDTEVQVVFLGMVKGKKSTYKNFAVNVPVGTELLDGSIAG